MYSARHRVQPPPVKMHQGQEGSELAYNHSAQAKRSWLEPRLPHPSPTLLLFFSLWGSRLIPRGSVLLLLASEQGSASQGPQAAASWRKAAPRSRRCLSLHITRGFLVLTSPGLTPDLSYLGDPGAVGQMQRLNEGQEGRVNGDHAASETFRGEVGRRTPRRVKNQKGVSF